MYETNKIWTCTHEMSRVLIPLPNLTQPDYKNKYYPSLQHSYLKTFTSHLADLTITYCISEVSSERAS